MGGLVGGIVSSVASNALGGLFGGKDGGGDGGSSSSSYTQLRPAWMDQAFSDIYNTAVKDAPSIFQPYTGQRVADLSLLQQNALQRALASNDLGQTDFNNIDRQLKEISNEPLTQVSTTANPQSINVRANPQSITTQGFGDANTAGYIDPYMQKVYQPLADELNRQADMQQAHAQRAAALGGKANSANANLGLAEMQRARQSNLAQLQGNALQQAANLFETDQSRNLAGQQAQANIYNQDILNALSGQQAQANIYNQDIQNKMRADLANQAQDYQSRLNRQNTLNDIFNNGMKQRELGFQDTNLQAQLGSQLQQQQQQNQLNAAQQAFYEQNYAPKNQLDWLNSILQSYQPVSQSTNGSSTGPMPNKTLSNIATGSSILKGVNSLTGGGISNLFGGNTYYGSSPNGYGSSSSGGYYSSLPSLDSGNTDFAAPFYGNGPRYYTPTAPSYDYSNANNSDYSSSDFGSSDNFSFSF